MYWPAGCLWLCIPKFLLDVVYCNGVGSCSALGGHCTLSGHNFYGENYIPMEGHQKLGGAPAPLAPLVPTPMDFTGCHRDMYHLQPFIIVIGYTTTQSKTHTNVIFSNETKTPYMVMYPKTTADHCQLISGQIPGDPTCKALGEHLIQCLTSKVRHVYVSRFFTLYVHQSIITVWQVVSYGISAYY